MTVVRLTFDFESPGQSHWSPDAPRLILDALKVRDARATFFVQGRWAQTEPDLVRRMRDEGHLVGMHSHFHAPWDTMTWPGLREDVEKVCEVLAAAGIDVGSYARAPNGRMSDLAESVLAGFGLSHHGWNVDTGDWLLSTSIADIQRIVTKAPEGSVVLLHTWPATTAAALPLILDQIECVRMDAL
jgi:peptidoglycan/xylan/chitin deacetylase (PgdA/CDA1 family)